MPFQEWKEAALALDSYLNFDEWKFIDEDSLYDWRLIRKVLKSLKTLRAKDDARGVMGILETCLRTNFAGIESARYKILFNFCQANFEDSNLYTDCIARYIKQKLLFLDALTLSPVDVLWDEESP